MKTDIMFISSMGGHLTQLLQLKQLMQSNEYILITEKCDVTIPMKEKYKIEYLVSGTRDELLKYMFIFPFNIIKSLILFFKYRPKVIVTTGSHTAVPMCYIGKLFKSRIIYIESFARMETRSLTGRILYPIADDFIVQWESMLKVYPKATYLGSIY